MVLVVHSPVELRLRVSFRSIPSSVLKLHQQNKGKLQTALLLVVTA